MSLQQLISPSVPTLTTDDTGDRALALMEEDSMTQLPIVSGDNYIGLVQESELLDWAHPEMKLSEADFLHFKPAINVASHPFEAMRIANQMNLAVLPVLDHEQKYIGCLTSESLLKYITENSGLTSPGGIIVLEVAPRNYTMYEIARICENEDVTIMNAQVHANETGHLEVTLKLNRTAIDAVVASFERYNYVVKEVYGEDAHDDDIASKYHLLMNYINM